jgi:hypothetical protein
MGSLADTEAMDGNCAKAQAATSPFYPCISSDKHQYGYAISGIKGTGSIPLFLDVDMYEEPDINNHQPPVAVSGTVTITGPLEAGTSYTIYRYDDIEAVPERDYPSSNFTHKYELQANGTTSVFKDPNSFRSDGAVYYRCTRA